MGANYTRQSTYTDGDTISAADTNDEFDQLLAAFAANTGHSHDGTTGEGGPITGLATNTITFGTGADTDIVITFDANTNDGVISWMEDEDYFQFSDEILMTATEKILFRDTALSISSTADGQLDIDADTEVEITAPLVEISADATVGDDFTLKSDAAVLGFGADTDVTLTHVADTALLLNSSRQLQFGDSGTYIHQSADGVLDLVSDTEIEINATTIDINGNAEISGTSTLTGNVTLGAQLRMPDNTEHKILISDGTSYEEKAVGDLSEITSVAQDDVFLAVDTSGGGLKKIQRSAIVSGLAAGTMTDVVDDTSPQLGGDLDMNSRDIVTTSNATIDLAPDGTGTVVVRGNTNSGRIVFNCESNSHGQTIASQPHSASVTNTMLLPAGADSTLVSLVSTDTLTNKTLTTPVIAEIDSSADITLDADADIVLDAAGGNIEFKDAGTLQLTIDMDGTAGAQVIQLGVDSDDLIFKQYDGSTVLTLDDDTTVKVATDLTVGDDLGLISDGAVVTFGANSEITLTHVHDSGLALKHTATGDDKPIVLALQTGETDIAADDVIGSINFQAPDEGTGTDAILVAAGIEAVSEGDFSSSNNATKLSFKTAASEAAAEKMSLSSTGSLTIAGKAVGPAPTAVSASSSHVTHDLAVNNNFITTCSAADDIAFTNLTAGQSGNIMFIKSGTDQPTASAEVAINASALTSLATAGTYHLTYFVKATSGGNHVLVSVSGALT